MSHKVVWKTAIVAVAFGLVQVSTSKASPVTYTFDGTGSVTLGGTLLGDPSTGVDTYSVVFTGDTSTIDTSSSPFFTNFNLTGTFTDGTHIETITGKVESNSSLTNIDFYNTFSTNGLGLIDVALAGYALNTSIGPIGPILASSGNLTPTFGGGSFATAGSDGDLQFTGSDSLTFTATVNTTPLPAALPLFATGLGTLGLLGWRRKRKAAASAT
jgi:hypothetical protein